MLTPLVEKSSSQQRSVYHFPLCTITFFTFLFLTISSFSHYFARPEENSVGVAAGSRVMILQQIENIPPTTRAIVVLKLREKVYLQILNFAIRTFIVANMSQVAEVAMRPSPLAPPRISDWPYWDILKQDPWFTEHTCLGPLFCELEHQCMQSIFAFNRAANALIQPFHRTMFEYNSQLGYREIQTIFTNYMDIIMRTPGHRLFAITIHFHHAFLIEQSGTSYRIYQSRQKSFDLQYWTGHSEMLCEPGMTISQQELNPVSRERNIQFGDVDDTRRIQAARILYGNLRAVTYPDMKRLMLDLAYGFFLTQRRHTQGGQSLLPANETFGPYNSNKFLGKSAIKISSLVESGYPPRFEVEINFIEFTG